MNSDKLICLCGTEFEVRPSTYLVECYQCGARYVPPVTHVNSRCHVPNHEPASDTIEAFGAWYSYEHRN